MKCIENLIISGVKWYRLWSEHRPTEAHRKRCSHHPARELTRQQHTSLPPARTAMQAAAPRESLPGAVASLFEEFAAVSGATAAPGGAGPQIRTSEEWAALLSAVTSAGLLPQPELLKASQDLALPASLSSLQTRLNGAYEPPRAPAIDGLLDGAVARVRHLHGLLAQWELSALSAEQTARMVLMIEALRGRLSASIAQLRMWHDGIHAALGPERCQSLFWDLVDPITFASPS